DESLVAIGSNIGVTTDATSECRFQCWSASRRSNRPTTFCLLQQLTDRLGLDEGHQLIRTSTLGVGAAQLHPAERVDAHHRAGGLAVEIKVADLELLARPLQLGAILRVD